MIFAEPDLKLFVEPKEESSIGGRPPCKVTSSGGGGSVQERIRGSPHADGRPDHAAEARAADK